MELFHDAEVGASEAFSPTVLAIPWLRRLPSWLPGGYWQRKLPYWKLLAKKAIEFPLEAARDAMVTTLFFESVCAVCEGF